MEKGFRALPFRRQPKNWTRPPPLPPRGSDGRYKSNLILFYLFPLPSFIHFFL